MYVIKTDIWYANRFFHLVSHLLSIWLPTNHNLHLYLNFTDRQQESNSLKLKQGVKMNSSSLVHFRIKIVKAEFIYVHLPTTFLLNAGSEMNRPRFRPYITHTHFTGLLGTSQSSYIIISYWLRRKTTHKTFSVPAL